MSIATATSLRSTPGASSAARVWPWLLLAVAIGMARSLAFLLYPTISFDADQAVVGLMAKHIAEGRAWPVHQYALTYVLELTAYLIAPFMWVLGPTLTAVRLPLLLINVGVGLALVTAVVRAGIRPALAVTTALPLIAAPPGTSAALMDALGMTIEPLAFVLALWFLRNRPVALGIVAAVGFRVREFVAYGVAALLLVDCLRGQLTTRAALRHWGLAAVGAVAALAVLAGLARFETPRGPGTWVDGHGDELATLSGAFCFAPAWALHNVVHLGAQYLGQLYGAVPMSLETAIVRSGVTQGAPWLWPLLGLTLAALALRAAWRWRTLWAARRTETVGLGVYLTTVGAQAALVYAVSRCGPLSVVTLRYALLALFLPTGVALLFLAVEPRRMVRAAGLAAFVAVAVVSLRAHGALLAEQWAAPHVPNRVVLTEALLQRGIRYAYADYWTAYYVAFLSREQILVVPDVLSRIAFYERVVGEHQDEAVRLSVEPCGDAPPIAPGYHVCHGSP